jgi:hypothetical protein
MCASLPRTGWAKKAGKIAMSCLDNGRYTVGAGAVGLIRPRWRPASLRQYAQDLARRSANTSWSSRRSPHEVHYEYGRLMTLKVGWMKNQASAHQRNRCSSGSPPMLPSMRQRGDPDPRRMALAMNMMWSATRATAGERSSMRDERDPPAHAGHALGYRKTTSLRCELPAYDE